MTMPTATSWAKSFVRQLKKKVLRPLEEFAEKETPGVVTKFWVCDQLKWVLEYYYDGYRHKYNAEPDLPISERWLRYFYFETRELYKTKELDENLHLSSRVI